MNRSIFSCFVLSFTFLFLACKHDVDTTASPTGGPQLQMLSRALPQTSGTNGVTGTIQQLNFKLYKIQVISENRQIYTVNREKQEIDLIALKSDNLMELVKTELPSGRYCEVRMFYSRNGTAVINNKSYPISLKDKPEIRYPWEWGRRIGHKRYSAPEKPSDNPCFLPRMKQESKKRRGSKYNNFSDMDFFNSSDNDDFNLDSGFGQPFWRWGRHWLPSRALYHLVRGVSVVRMKSAFELTAGRIYSMTINFNPSQSVYKEFGRYYLDPDMELTSSTLVNGPFSISGLIQDETVVTELSADGSLRMLTTLDPRIELHGVYFFNQQTRILSLTPTDIQCNTCNVEEIPSSILYNFPNSNVNVSSWDSNGIIGSVSNGSLTTQVNFQKISEYALNFGNQFTSFQVRVSYPFGSYNGKFGALSLSPKASGGRSFVDIQQINGNNATFVFKIPYKELPGGIPSGNKDFIANPIVAANIEDFKISAKNNGAVCGSVQVSSVKYQINIPVADKPIAAAISYAGNP